MTCRVDLALVSMSPKGVQMSQTTEAEKLRKIAQKKGLPDAKKHLMLCIGPKCCSEAEGALVWKHLKKQTKELADQGVHVMRTKVGCLRVCAKGPVLVVYPEGRWYHSADSKFVDKLLTGIAKDGQLIAENQFLENALN